jgi:ABC transporter with metal-binding/Fe-S-binding domain ATP-binding protein
MKAVSLLSGGKDSFLSLLIALSIGMDVERTITVKAEQDSFMFHFPNVELGSKLSDIMGIRNSLIDESSFQETLSKFQGYFLVAGAVESEFQKTRLEEICQEYGLKTFFPLWRKDQESIIRDFISSGSRGIFVSVAAEGLGEDFLGMPITEKSLERLKAVKRKFGISIVGEGGEYETLVTGSPFASKSIEIIGSEIIDRGIQKNLKITSYRIVNPSRNGIRQTDR